MTTETWLSIVTSFGAMAVAGFGAWMFRIDRAVSRIAYIAESFHEHKEHVAKTHESIFAKIGSIDSVISKNRERISAIEARHARGDAHS